MVTSNQMVILHVATGVFDSSFNGDGMSWLEYKKWSGLKHLTETVSLDSNLNENLVVPDFNNVEDWNNIDVFESWQTGFYKTVDFVLKRMKPSGKFNLLSVVINPTEVCENIKLEYYDFVGYDLLDQSFGNSALTNCGGYDETFLPNDLNDKGLIDSFSKTYDINKRLFENNPNEYHADTNVIAVWRHKTIGR